jgi:hypothetical protein
MAAKVGMSAGIFQPLEEGQYRLAFPEYGIEFHVDHLRREHHELFGELTVSCGLAAARTVDDVLSVGTFNISSPRARQERARACAERARTHAIDWLGLLEELCQRILAAERAGQPALVLRDLPLSAPVDYLCVEGLTLLRSHPVVLFGDGGTAKSYLALLVAGQLARRGVTVLYADWELAADEHRDRLERIFGANDLPAILYARCDKPMTYEAERLRRVIARDEVQYLICDSVAFACDGPPEAAEVAGRYFQALRQMRVGSLHLAHTNRSDRSDEKPFGSTFWHNGARSTWHVKLAAPAVDTGRITVGLYNKKSNLGPLRPAVGFHIAFDDTRTRFERIDITSVDELAEALPLWQRIRHSVQHTPQTLISLAQELGKPVDSVDKAVRRKNGMFTRVAGADGVTRIALLETRRTA